VRAAVLGVTINRVRVEAEKKRGVKEGAHHEPLCGWCGGKEAWVNSAELRMVVGEAVTESATTGRLLWVSRNAERVVRIRKNCSRRIGRCQCSRDVGTSRGDFGEGDIVQYVGCLLIRLRFKAVIF
jgi:hypothetical protein